MITNNRYILKLFALVVFGVSFTDCKSPAEHMQPPPKLFVNGRKFTYKIVNTAQDQDHLTNKSNVVLTCYNKYKPGEYGIFKAGQVGDTTQINIGWSYDATSEPYWHTGLIENDSILWSHPPREEEFAILELSPFPFIKFPLKLGRHWNDQLEVGPGYGDPKWGVKSIIQQVSSSYQVVGKRTIDTHLGQIECWVIQATALCQQGNSTLELLYSPYHGFVKMSFKTVNNKYLVMELIGTSTINKQPFPFLKSPLDK